VAPQLAPGPLAVTTPITFSPNGDGSADSVTLPYSTNEAGSIVVSVRDESNALVRSFAATALAGAGTVSWAGDTNAGATTPDGAYTVSLAPRDRAGNLGGERSRPVVVYTVLRSVTAAPILFFPQDGDAYARTTMLSFTLSRPAVVSWTVRNASGGVVATRYAGMAMSAGTYTWAWDGRTSAGSYVPRGTYYATVTASRGSSTISQKAAVRADAFRITSTDTTPARGQWLTITAVSAENLSVSARLVVYQPGHAGVAVTMTRVATRTYSARIHLFSWGPTGTLTIKVSGRDAARHLDTSYQRLPLH
jgi:flagellar hook assembly protein FlgD